MSHYKYFNCLFRSYYSILNYVHTIKDSGIEMLYRFVPKETLYFFYSKTSLKSVDFVNGVYLFS